MRQHLRTLLGALAVTSLLGAGAATASEHRPDVHADPPVVGLEAPAIARDSPVQLSSGDLRAAVDELAAGRSTLGRAAHLTVEVHHATDVTTIRTLIARAGGTVTGEVPGQLVEARVPVDRLEWLEQRDEVDRLARPARSFPVGGVTAGTASENAALLLSGAVTGAHVVESNADAWHASGWDGSGVKIGVIDVFVQSDWDAAVTSGDLPTPAGTFCRVGGSSCDVWTTFAGNHGNNVAEVIHDMAPGGDLYLATALTAADLQAAVDYFAAQGVDVISRSMGSPFDGPGDGTGPLAAVVDNAVADGMAWFNAAGNAGVLDDAGLGGYYRGTWSDTDADGWFEFASGDEALGFICGGMLGVRWSDWADPQATDYDVYVFDSAAQLIDASVDEQPTQDPVERVTNCGSPGDVAFLQIGLFAANGGTSGDVIEFLVNRGVVEHSSNPHSAAVPVVDSFNDALMGVGAIDPPTGDLVADYSSRGPTNDERIKPDIAAQSCLATTLTNCFNGTSAATPVVAGAAALVLHSGAAAGPADLVGYLETNAVADRGPGGPDHSYGAGELALPAPPSPPGPPGAPTGVGATPGDGQATVTWTPPADDGGDPNLTYTVTGSPGGSCQTSAPTTSCIATGLTNGIAHTFTVVATNSHGSGPASDPSPPVTPQPVIAPGVPTEVDATPGDGQATVTWTPPADDGGDPNLTYTVTGSPAGSCQTSAPTTSCIATGLTNGIAHTFTVVATNSHGSGPASDPSPPVTPIGPPSSPRQVDADRDATTAVVSWNPPADDGGDPNLTYTVTGSPGGATCTVAAPATSCTVTGLANWIAYAFRVTATNAAGTSAASPPSAAVLSALLADCSGPLAHPFVDVSATSFAHDDIGCIFVLRVTTGTSPITYSPTDLVTREQMGAFLARLYRTITAEACAGGPIPFLDVSTISFAHDDIGCIFDLGITTGTSPITYSPADFVTREQMGAFLARLYRAVIG